jgi:isoprene synthase
MQDERYKDRAKKLEEDVGSMINNENADLLETLELIDDIQRLGLGYRFERDITMKDRRWWQNRR